MSVSFSLSLWLNQLEFIFIFVAIFRSCFGKHEVCFLKFLFWCFGVLKINELSNFWIIQLVFSQPPPNCPCQVCFLWLVLFYYCIIFPTQINSLACSSAKPFSCARPCGCQLLCGNPCCQLEYHVVTDVVDNQQVNLYSDIFNNVSPLVQAGHGFMGTETVKWWHGNLGEPEPQDNYMVGKGEVCTWAKQSIMPDLIQVSIAWSN